MYIGANCKPLTQMASSWICDLAPKGCEKNEMLPCGKIQHPRFVSCVIWDASFQHFKYVHYVVSIFHVSLCTGQRRMWQNFVLYFPRMLLPPKQWRHRFYLKPGRPNVCYLEMCECQCWFVIWIENTPSFFSDFFGNFRFSESLETWDPRFGKLRMAPAFEECAVNDENHLERTTVDTCQQVRTLDFFLGVDVVKLKQDSLLVQLALNTYDYDN